MIVREIECRTILTRSGIPGVEYAVNPYVGCAHGCVYCYATFMKRFTGHSEEWGTFVDVRVNAAERLAREVRRARPGPVLLSSVTDAYQPLEAEHGLTRACLEVLVDAGWPVSILTKSGLVRRDLDLLRQLRDVDVGFTITTLDEGVRERFEPGAAPVAQRLEAMAELAAAGLEVWAFCGPLLPGLSDDEAQMDALFAAVRQAGGRRLLVDSLNLRGASWGRVRAVLERHYPRLVPLYQELTSDRGPYHAALAERARRLAGRYGLAVEV
jgi:DNA repair photolyase